MRLKLLALYPTLYSKLLLGSIISVHMCLIGVHELFHPVTCMCVLGGFASIDGPPAVVFTQTLK